MEMYDRPLLRLMIHVGAEVAYGAMHYQLNNHQCNRFFRRRELGELRALRNERGLTVEQVAEEVLCSLSKMSRMETS
jgi:Helix-turn-helix domain